MLVFLFNISNRLIYLVLKGTLSQRSREMGRLVFHLRVHFPNAYTKAGLGQGEARRQEVHLGLPMPVTGTQY